VVDKTTLQQANVGAAVAVFIQSHCNDSTAGQFNGIGRAGFVVILIAVEQQNTGSGIGYCGGVRYIKLEGQKTFRLVPYHKGYPYKRKTY
jgi:hypothetical protein